METPQTQSKTAGLACGFAANAIVLMGLAMLTILIGGKDISVGGLSWSDAPLHAMDGVFIHDLLSERPTESLRSWAEQFYLRHQCLGIVVYYPPLFAAVEAIVFLLFGVSIIAARAAVLIFAIGAVWLIYLLARKMFGTAVGLSAAILSIATPAGVMWSREVMLEWPATFFILLSLLAYWRYFERPGWTNGVLVAFGCLAAYLTKQTAVFVLLVILIHALASGKWRVLLQRSFLVPLVIGLLGIAGYGLATTGYNRLAPQLILGSVPFKHLTNLDSWTWYSSRLSAIIGWPVLVGALAGMAVLIFEMIKNRRSPSPSDTESVSRKTDNLASLRLPAIWFVVWWLICSVFAAKEERYFFFAVPAVALLCAAGLNRINGSKRFGIGTVTLGFICCLQLFDALTKPTHRIPDMRPTVDFLTQQGDVDLVLVDAVRDGQFIFDVRMEPAARGRIVPMRASKFLYSRSARTRYDYQAQVSTPEELFAWLDKYGIRYVVIEDRLPTTPDKSWDVPPRIMLREKLKDKDRFERVFSQSLAGDDPLWAEVNLVTYRCLQAKPRQSDSITVHIPAMGRDITLTLPPVPKVR